MVITSQTKKYIIYYIVPMGLAFLWILLSIYTLLTYNASFTVLPYSHMQQDVISPRRITLTAGKKITGQFVATDDNLGAVAVRLHNFHGGGVEEDRIMFRFKEKGAKFWYYVHEYTGGQFHELDLFPFGFPIISHSQGKTYVFEVESKYGYNLTSLDLTDLDPIVVSEYQYPKSLLLQNKELMNMFIKKKITYQLQNLDIRIMLLIFPLPLLLYLLGLSPLGKAVYSPVIPLLNKIKKRVPIFFQYFANKISPYDLCILLVLIIDTLFVNGPNETVIFTLFVLIFIKLFVFKKKDYNEFPTALFFMLLCPLFLIIHNKPAAERAAVWSYVLLIIGTGKLVADILMEKTKKAYKTKK